MCQVDKSKCDGGPVVSNTAAQGDELEWKGGEQRPDRNAGSHCAGDEDLHPQKIYSCCVPSSMQAEESLFSIRAKTSPGVFGGFCTDFSGF